jgi:hypothetical protein
MVHTVSLILVVMGMVVGSRWVHQKRGCAKLRVGRLWSQHCAKNCGDSDPVRRRRKRSAPRAYRRRRSCPSPPLGMGAPHRTILWWGGTLRLRALVPNSPWRVATLFTPAQPPLVVNSPGEKTNLTQKQPDLDISLISNHSTITATCGVAVGARLGTMLKAVKHHSA